MRILNLETQAAHTHPNHTQGPIPPKHCCNLSLFDFFLPVTLSFVNLGDWSKSVNSEAVERS